MRSMTKAARRCAHRITGHTDACEMQHESAAQVLRTFCALHRAES